jgi:hypothetical protein
MRQSKKYEKDIVSEPTIAVVLEDNIWEYGEKKKKAKINIPSLMPLQKIAESAVSLTVDTNDKVKQKKIEKTQNFIEIFLPDSLYTYPSEDKVKNKSQSLYGAKETNPANNGTNGKYVKSMVRRVNKETKLVIVVVDGYVREENIKVLFKFDDYEEGRTGHHGVTNNTINAALR